VRAKSDGGEQSNTGSYPENHTTAAALASSKGRLINWTVDGLTPNCSAILRTASAARLGQGAYMASSRGSLSPQRLRQRFERLCRCSPASSWTLRLFASISATIIAQDAFASVSWTVATGCGSRQAHAVSSFV
jgi:hypothetical protein